MRITGPDNFKIIIKSEKHFDIISPEGDGKIHGRAAESKRPKVYVISYNKKPIYIGITNQNIRNRLRNGFKASGKNGYHGYAWRKHLKKVDMDIWYDEKGHSQSDTEAIEAELVFNVRQHYNQWPEFQTEIHFHQSEKKHIEEAKKIFDYYRS